MSGGWRAAILALMTAAASAAGPMVVCARAQQRFTYVGPKQCTNCHDHEAEKAWYEKKEIPEVHRLFPEQNNAGHINSLKQLETPKSDQFAKAVGLADKYEPAGLCATCHATVFKGDVNAGVSCESCHGPASGYLEPHQKKDAYDISVTQYGMTRLVGNFAGWTQQCTNCHVMTDERLIAAGHPSGDDFDLSKKFVPVSLHFKKTYTPSDVEAVARGEMQAALRRRRAVTATASAAPAPVEEPAAAGSSSAALPAESSPVVAPPTAAAPPVARPADAASGRMTSAEKPARSSATAASTRPPRPRRAAAPAAPIDPARPPAGSPTSIEPPPLATARDGAAPAAVAASPAPAPPAPPAAPPAATPAPAAVTVQTSGGARYLWFVVAVAVVGAAIALFARTRR